jgi:hypothetical protein
MFDDCSNYVFHLNNHRGQAYFSSLSGGIYTQSNITNIIFTWHAGHIQQIFSQYRRLAFSADWRYKIKIKAFLHKTGHFL